MTKKIKDFWKFAQYLQGEDLKEATQGLLDIIDIELSNEYNENEDSDKFWQLIKSKEQAVQIYNNID